MATSNKPVSTTVTTPVATTAPTPATATQPKDHMLTNAAYDLLKFVALIVLPVAGAVYFVVGQVVTLPNPESVVGIITAADALLGGLLKAGDVSYKSSSSKFDGIIEVAETDAKKVYSLILKDDPQFIDQATEILLQVKAAESA